MAYQRDCDRWPANSTINMARHWDWSIQKEERKCAVEEIAPIALLLVAVISYSGRCDRQKCVN